ncbi:MAG: Uma2 family endonuclease [Thermoanaerobaculia bacterium]
MSVLPLEQEIDYPTSDGQPMAETPEHARVILDLLFGLNGRYVAVPDAWVGGNFFLYYEEGNPKARVSPDVMLVKGAGKWSRPNYRLWQEKPPTLIVEVTSRKTRRKDVGPKKSLYERLAPRSTSSSIPSVSICGHDCRASGWCAAAISPSLWSWMARC